MNTILIRVLRMQYAACKLAMVPLGGFDEKVYVRKIPPMLHSRGTNTAVNHGYPGNFSTGER